jgi:hypothetical protein
MTTLATGTTGTRHDIYDHRMELTKAHGISMFFFTLLNLCALEDWPLMPSDS